ncbi:MAG TPA: ATP-binding protein [Acidimicrobiia bacterium]|nr:ATP-binding protein [Acidimicrobiia bacterium]
MQIPQRDSTSRQGLGLGLHICNEIVTRHGGKLWVESDPPHGSRFCFTLPVFSISEAVRGTVEKARAKACDVILFEVRLPTKGLASQVAWRLLDQAHWVIRQATPPGDLVLPASEDDDEHGLIHAVVAVGHSNASAVAARITNLLMEEVDVCSRGMPEVVFDVISAGGDSPDLPGDWVDRAVDRIRARVA